MSRPSIVVMMAVVTCQQTRTRKQDQSFPLPSPLHPLFTVCLAVCLSGWLAGCPPRAQPSIHPSLSHRSTSEHSTHRILHKIHKQVTVQRSAMPALAWAAGPGTCSWPHSSRAHTKNARFVSGVGTKHSAGPRVLHAIAWTRHRSAHGSSRSAPKGARNT